MPEPAYILAIDTCGPSGSVAVGRLTGNAVEVLGQVELEGRSYSATLVAAVGAVLAEAGVAWSEVDAMVTVSGPGSFTGVRLGLAAVKGLAESRRIPVVAVSRLEVLAANSGLSAAALDAHRKEVYLRLAPVGEQATESLAGADELAAFVPPAQVAVCDDAAQSLLKAAWPATELLRVAPPTAADALELSAARVAAGEFVDLALVDGHYLRRSDAEIFGEPAAAKAHS